MLYHVIPLCKPKILLSTLEVQVATSHHLLQGSDRSRGRRARWPELCSNPQSTCFRVQDLEFRDNPPPLGLGLCRGRSHEWGVVLKVGVELLPCTQWPSEPTPSSILGQQQAEKT